MGKRDEGYKHRGERTTRGNRAAAGRPTRSVAPSETPLVVNGWTLLFWSAFRDRWAALGDAAESARASDPIGYLHAPDVKFFRTVRDLVFKEIPANPDHPQFRLGKTLGHGHTHWRRATFHRRFRLFFRFHTVSRTIVYAWLNDENTLRKSGSHTDPYHVFSRMLERGTPPNDWAALMRACDAASAASE